jgi:hypothetical protein
MSSTDASGVTLHHSSPSQVLNPSEVEILSSCPHTRASNAPLVPPLSSFRKSIRNRNQDLISSDDEASVSSSSNVQLVLNEPPPSSEFSPLSASTGENMHSNLASSSLNVAHAFPPTPSLSGPANSSFVALLGNTRPSQTLHHPRELVNSDDHPVTQTMTERVRKEQTQLLSTSTRLTGEGHAHTHRTDHSIVVNDTHLGNTTLLDNEIDRKSLISPSLPSLSVVQRCDSDTHGDGHGLTSTTRVEEDGSVPSISGKAEAIPHSRSSSPFPFPSSFPSLNSPSSSFHYTYSYSNFSTFTYSFIFPPSLNLSPFIFLPFIITPSLILFIF